MTSQLFTVHSGVLPVTALVFYELKPLKRLCFPCKSCYLIYLISNILQHSYTGYTVYAGYLIQNDIKMAYLYSQLKRTLAV